MIVGVRMQDREFREILQPPVALRAESLAWDAMGGPAWARMSGEGNVNAVGDALNWLRRPVIVEIDNGPAWWGYIDAVTVRMGAYSIGASLETMANRVCVAYSYVEPGTQEVGQRQTTAWASNDDSIAVYGTKELRLSVDGASPATAEGVRDTFLAQQAWPRAILSQEDGGEATVQLSCRGWWDTLAWVYYANSNTTSRGVTNQIGDAVLSAEFLEGMDIVDAVSTSLSEYRDGESTLQDVILTLLSAGESDDLMLATVTPDRVLKIYKQPFSSSSNLRLTADGRLRSAAGLLVNASPAGLWCDVDLPLLNMFNHVASPSPFFVRRAELEVETERWRLEPWGAPSAWELTQLARG